jgi:hypothetical protein
MHRWDFFLDFSVFLLSLSHSASVWLKKKNSAGHLMEFGEGAFFANILKTCVIFLYFSRLCPEGLLLDHEPMIRFGYQVEKKFYKSLITLS